MNGLRLTQPSVRRVIGFIVLTTVVLSVITGLLLFTGELVTNAHRYPTPVGDWVRLFFLNITMYGPMAVITFWQISVPLILVLGPLAASLHRTRPS
jgi:hypothetical protein